MDRGKLPHALIGGSIVPSAGMLVFSALEALRVSLFGWRPSFAVVAILYFFAVLLLSTGTGLKIRWRDSHPVEPGFAPFLFAVSVLLIVSMPLLLMLIPLLRS